MTRLIRCITFTLALLIAVTSQQMAMARGMMKDAQGQVILCTGTGPVTVTLDAQGNPMGPVHICPDCALTLLAWVDAVPAVAAVFVNVQTLTQTPVIVSQFPVVPTRTRVRDPPLYV